jgi:uncharacterized protein
MEKPEKIELYNKISTFLKAQNIKKAFIFGSYAKDSETPASDIDLLVEFSEDISLMQFVNIEQNLSDYIGIKVDLLTKSSISPYIFDYIKNDFKVLFQ